MRETQLYGGKSLAVRLTRIFSMDHILTHLSQDRKLVPALEVADLDLLIPEGEVFESLVRAIVYQQLSGKVADVIHRRFLELLDLETPNPERVLGLDPDNMRKAGLSRSKTNYIRNIAEFFQQAAYRNQDWHSLSDEALVSTLTQIKGVGEWTVQMLLISTMAREDVFPVNDLGIQQGIRGLYGLEELDKKELKKEMLALCKAWSPYRTYASRAIWRWYDLK